MDNLEVARALEAIREGVVQRAGYASRSEVPPLGAASPVADAADLARISAHLPVTPDLRLIGPVIGLARRGLRLGLRWYINPIVEQQNAFNESVVRALAALDARQGELERQLERRGSTGAE
jgi:hypothetical protein